MKFSMTGHEKGDLLIEVTSWSISVLNYPLMVIPVIIMRQQPPPFPYSYNVDGYRSHQWCHLSSK
jgi:hypothetical protein